MPTPPLERHVFAPVDVITERTPDGCLLMRSGQPLARPALSVGELFRHAAARAPDRVLVGQPDGHGWREVTYAQARVQVDAIAQSLLDRRLSRPVLILAGNGIEHLLMALACQTIGLPYIPVSTAYSLRGRDLRELRHIAQQTHPSLVLVEDASAYEPALEMVRSSVPLPLETVARTPGAYPATPFSALVETPATADVERAAAKVGPDTVAKYLFTSGSTSAPKAVITTHRMLCSNQQMIRQAWPFLASRPPVLLDWLPWSHTFGGSHNTNLVIANAGTLYIDDGRPVGEQFNRTMAHLTHISPTVYLSVPLALRMLATRLENDTALARHFFRRLDVLFYAAAALPQDTWDRLRRLAERHADHPVALTTAWGSTETAPAALSTHFPSSRSDCVGIPLPGVTVKLVPTGHKTEIRVKGPTVTPGYLGRSDLTMEAFDRDGYLKTGDAVELIDPARPHAGLRFNGRLTEDFKLDSGTWVNTGAVKAALLQAAGDLLTDCVITGHDRPYIGALAWPNERACRALSDSSQPWSRLHAHPALKAHLEAALDRVNHETGTSRQITRLALLDEPPMPEAGEITDKGYINQATTLTRRASSVADLYQEPRPSQVIQASDART